MLLSPWEKLPDSIKNEAVKPYYDILKKKVIILLIKRIFDFILSGLMIIVFSPLLLTIALLIKLDSKGPIFFKQTRVTTNHRLFKILKFRTMVENAEQLGSLVTPENDVRITKIGRILRRYRLDEIPQLFNVFVGDMSFVGTRPEVLEYVKQYTPEMYATLLMPAGITSLTSILYKDEEKILSDTNNPNEIYINKILPDKMKLNLSSLKNISLLNDIKIMVYTLLAVTGLKINSLEKNS